MFAAIPCGVTPMKALPSPFREWAYRERSTSTRVEPRGVWLRVPSHRGAEPFVLITSKSESVLFLAYSITGPLFVTHNGGWDEYS